MIFFGCFIIIRICTDSRIFRADEPLDREWVVDRPIPVIWALGRLDHAGEPAFHRLYHKHDVFLHLGKNPPENDCFSFVV